MKAIGLNESRPEVSGGRPPAEGPRPSGLGLLPADLMAVNVLSRSHLGVQPRIGRALPRSVAFWVVLHRRDVPAASSAPSPCIRIPGGIQVSRSCSR